jgi:6-pyruvoyl-tetrahydropterin synthase
MFEISVEREFCAAHAIVIGGVREVTHGHNFHLTVTVGAPTLDHEELLVDFHALERLVDAVIRPFHNADLNALPPFAPGNGRQAVNPTAEAIARHIGESVREQLPKILPQGRSVRLAAIRLTEAPGCAVVWRPL